MDELEKAKERRRKQVLRRRFEAKDFVRRLKENSCKDCGKRYHHCQMDFVRPDGIGTTISNLLLRSKDRILEVATRCDLVCANCGRLRVWKRQRAARMGPT